MHNIQEREFSTSSLIYLIKAQKKSIDFKKLKHFSFFNPKKSVSDSIYYEKGTLYQKDIKVDFKRAYFFEGNLYMQGCYATFKDGYIKAESAIYKRTTIEFKKLIMKKKNKLYHKFKYIYTISKM
jgi:hypothetical protein